SEKESEFNENYQAQLKHYEFLVKNYYADLISKQYYQIKSALYYPIEKKLILLENVSVHEKIM
nr:hypothetical protein [Gammaproteobacteria bacterium]